MNEILQLRFAFNQEFSNKKRRKIHEKYFYFLHFLLLKVLRLRFIVFSKNLQGEIMAKNASIFSTNSLNENTLLFTVEEASRMLNLKISRIRSAIFKREISYVKFGALIRFRPEDLSNFINKNLIQPRAL